MNEKKIAGIVAYEPDYSRLCENIDALASQVDSIIIYCNSSLDFGKLPHINYIVMNNEPPQNDGIAHALNQIMGKAEDLGAEWCLLLDQDSVIPDDLMTTFIMYIESPISNMDRVAVITPQVYDKAEHKKVKKSDTIEEVKECITSASYNNVSIWKKTGGFREDFFIDYVDWEYCARARKNGYKIIRMNNIILDHQLGRLTYHNFCGMKLSTYNHSAFRKFYITRNSFVINYLYPDEVEFMHPYLRTLKRAFIVIAFENHKSDKIKAMMKGFIDFKGWKSRERKCNG